MKKTFISNQEIADILHKYADILEIHAQNPYRIRAYHRAANTINRLDKSIFTMAQEGIDLTTIANIGPGIASQLTEILKTHQLPQQVNKVPKEKPLRNELLQIPGLGKKRIKLLKDAEITTIKALQESIVNGQLRSMFKWATGPFTTKLLANLEHPKRYEKLLKYKVVELIITYMQAQLSSIPDIVTATPASTYRRKAELVGNVDWVIQSRDDKKVIENICRLDSVKEIVSRTEHSVSVILHSSLLMTFCLVKLHEIGKALLLHTGSEEHINALEILAKTKHINFKNISAADEKDIYKKLNLAYIEPELRENRGEIMAAQKNQLPVLIALDDIKGDLHTHTNETDGTETLEIMVQAAMQLGHEYYAITDHSKRLAITNGLDEKRLLKQIELINELNVKYPNIKILKSIEVDILEDGSLDLSNDVLKELDLRVCSIHSKFRIPADKQTERIIRAMDNPYFNILGHMTGRLITSRSPYELHIEKIFQAAKERGCFIELNAQPSRLDINDSYCYQAKQVGVKVAISSDAHSIRELSYLRFGINQARRGWLEKDDVINTRTWTDLKKLLKR